MKLIGPDGFFLYLAAVATMVGSGAGWRGAAEKLRTRGGGPTRAASAPGGGTGTMRGADGS